MRFTDLVFDLYGTLVDIHTEESESVWEKTALYFGFHGVHHTAASLREAFERAMQAREARAGQSYECFPDIPFEQVMAELFRAGGITDQADALGVNAAQLFRISSIEYIRIYPGVLEALRLLREHGFRLWLLSNAQAVFTAYEMRHLGLGPQFDGVLLSSDYGCRKPDARFFAALTSTYSLDPSKCLMIGNDRETDIAGAQAAGMATLFMHTALTPAQQAAADPSLYPHAAPHARHYEFEGDDWSVLSSLIANL
ncbi:MAG: HAD family hydrolase [Clostridia bacterium]|nr:HAD family hydrolase [Clostridia bacterium]